MKKLAIVILSIVLVGSLLAGCGSSQDGSSGGNYKGLKIFYSISDGKDTFISLTQKAAESYAEDQGIDLTVADAGNDTLKQVSDMREAVSTGEYDSYVVCPVDADTTTQIMKVVGDAPIAFVNRSPASDKLVSNKYIFVGSDENDSAGYQAEYLTKYFKEQGKTEIKAVLLEGQFGHSAAKTRTSAVKSSLAKNGITVEYVFEDTANWSRDQAQEMFTNFLETGKEYDCVICNNDEMALGVIASMEENDIDPSSVPIVGVDATPDGCAAIKDGKMAFTAMQNATSQGSFAVEGAAELAMNGSVSNIEGGNAENTIIWVPFEPVDASNVSDYMK